MLLCGRMLKNLGFGAGGTGSGGDDRRDDKLGNGKDTDPTNPESESSSTSPEGSPSKANPTSGAAKGIKKRAKAAGGRRSRETLPVILESTACYHKDGSSTVPWGIKLMLSNAYPLRGDVRNGLGLF